MSNSSAADQIAAWIVSFSNSAPTIRSPQPSAVPPASPSTEARSAGSSRLASTNSAICEKRTTE